MIRFVTKNDGFWAFQMQKEKLDNRDVELKKISDDNKRLRDERNKYLHVAACFVYTCRRLIDLSLFDAACFVYTCRRLIDRTMIAGT